MGNKEIFRQFLKDWMASNWNGTQTAFAEYIGISRQSLSNVLNGYSGTSEETRISICNKLGVDYRSLLHLGNEKSNGLKVIKDNITPFPVEQIDPKLKSLISDLNEIFKFGNPAMISAVETGIASLKAVIQMERNARKKAALSSMEDEESLINPHAQKHLRAPLKKSD